MEYLKANKKSVEKAINTLKTGGVVIFPTETVYGIGCLLKSKEGIDRIFSIKKRDTDKKLQVLISNKTQLEELVNRVPKTAAKLIKKYWPGPLTIVFKKGHGTIGVRMPDHKVPLQIIEACGPIVATSANVSDEKAPVAANEVEISADILLDGGKCKIKEASTVIDVTSTPPKILRQGKIKPFKS